MFKIIKEDDLESYEVANYDVNPLEEFLNYVLIGLKRDEGVLKIN